MACDPNLNTLLDGFESIFSIDEIWDSLFAYTKELGIGAMSYYHHSPPGALDFDEKIFFARGFDSESVSDYKRRHTFFNCPLENRTIPFIKPSFWPKVCSELSLSDEQHLFLKSFYFTHHQSAMVIPVHGPHGRNGCIVLCFKDGDYRFSKSEIRRLQWASQYAHQTFCRLQAKKRAKPASLTTREREVLTWVARGKSNSVIADIVGISQHTVNGYLRRIYLKTGTSDRTTASLRGIGEALIDY